MERVEFKMPMGLNRALNPSDLPKNVWSDGINIRFKDGKASKAQGYERVFSGLPVDVLSLQPYFSNGVPYWVACTSTKIYRTEGGPSVDISRTTGGNYNASEDNTWNGGILNQVIIQNNGVDVPQAYLPSGTSFVNLPNWPSDTLAKIIRPFKNYLIALNITKTGVEFPHTVKWSSPADPGQVPGTWDETDPTNDAGENFLADTGGSIVDGRKLRDSFIIYKEDSVYTMRYVGGVFVFQFQQLFDDIGTLSTNCVAEFDGKHFVVGQGDIYVHNGVQKQSVIEGTMREYFFSTLKNTGLRRVFVVPDYANSEMWVCYPSSSSEDNSCDKALLWNWKDNTWTLRDLPDVFYGTYGVVNPQDPDYWDADTSAWETDTTVWGSSKYNPVKLKLIFTSTKNDKVYLVGDISLFDGVEFTSRLEKTGIYLGDDRGVKVVTSITPHVTGSGVMSVYVGQSNIMGGPITWSGPFPYIIGQQFKVDCRVVGRYSGVRFEASSGGDWSMNGFTMEYAPISGER